MKRITVLLLLLTVTVTSLRGQLIINHLNTDITKLSEAEINEAKSILHIAYAHTSHGSQLTDGMTGLVGFANGGGKGLSLPDSIFAWSDGTINGTLDLEDHYGDMGDAGYYPDWYNYTVSYLDNTDNSAINVMMWSWCGQAAGYTKQNMIDYYLNPMAQLETLYPNIKFVYMTCHLDGTGLTGNLNLRDQQIRNYCKTNKKILYDFEDIESYDPDGLVNYMELNANDNCDYDSSGFSRNWATRWQNSHTENVDWYNCSTAHSQPLNGNQKAFAAWALFAGIAQMIALEKVPANLTVSDTIVGSGKSACFDATDTITVAGDGKSVEFSSGSAVDLIAGKSIRLMPGFHACEGSATHAMITADSQYCYTSTRSISHPESNKSVTLKSPAVNSGKQNKEKKMKVFPNPNNGIFNIEMKNFDGPASICIINAIGEVVYQTQSANAGVIKPDLSAFNRGLYVVRVSDGKTIATQKMLFQ